MECCDGAHQAVGRRSAVWRPGIRRRGKTGRTIWWTLLLVFSTGWTIGQAQTPATIGHRLFDQLLRTYVHDGWVDYQGLGTEGREAFREYLDALAVADPSGFRDDGERITFWLNAYNALTIAGVLREYPLRSVRDVPGFFRRLRFKVAGRRLSLDDIEHGILRKEFEEPRIHFALVCASRSCPTLAASAFTRESLDDQLDTVTRGFLSRSKGLQIDREERVLRLSSIFKWYGEDFRTPEGPREKEAAVIQFISRYVPEPERAFLGEGRFRVEYLDYDWRLNDLVLRDGPFPGADVGERER